MLCFVIQSPEVAQRLQETNIIHVCNCLIQFLFSGLLFLLGAWEPLPNLTVFLAKTAKLGKIRKQGEI